MSAAWCQLLNAVHIIIWLYTLIMLAYAVVSWVPDLRGRWSDYVAMLVEPALAPVRRIVPPAAGIDWSFLIVMLILWLVDRMVIARATAACFFSS